MRDMNEYQTVLTNALNDVKTRLKQSYPEEFVPKVAIVLGSGIGEYAKKVENVMTIDYRELEGFPVSSVEGHRGRFVFGKINDVCVVVLQGRLHMYEGYEAADTVLPVRLAGLLGAKMLVLTNAAGAVNDIYQVGDLMLLSDHISSFVPSPLKGKNLDFLGTRFPDMSEVYDINLRLVAKKIASDNGILLREGVYLQLPGPNYETPAEIRMCRLLGADAVGMSTATEAIAARHMGMRVCGISCITNMAAGVTKGTLSHEEVAKAAKNVFPKLSLLIDGLVENEKK